MSATKSVKFKQEIRKRIIERLNCQPEDIRSEKSLKIKKLLFESEEFKSAEVILFYLSFDGEVDTYSMIEDSLKMGKTVAVPFIEKKEIFPCLIKSISSKDLKRGLYRIKQPKEFYPVVIESIDLVIVPGVCFDRKGNRLGRGKGYYDRLLKKLSPHTKKIGLAFDFQVLPSLLTQPHDSSVDRVISA